MMCNENLMIKVIRELNRVFESREVFYELANEFASDAIG